MESGAFLFMCETGENRPCPCLEKSSMFGPSTKTAAAVAIGDEYITLALIKTAPEEFVLSNIRGRVQMGKIHTAQDTFHPEKRPNKILISGAATP